MPLWEYVGVDVFAAVAEPHRREILDVLSGGEKAVGTIVTELSLAQPQVSKHLRVLKEAGLVDAEPRAQQRVYELRAKPLRELSQWLERYRRVWEARFDALDDVLDELEAAERKKENADGRRKRR